MTTDPRLEDVALRTSSARPVAAHCRTAILESGVVGTVVTNVTNIGSGGGGGVVELGRRLLTAARDGDTDAVRDLMVMGAAFTSDWLGATALHLAAGNGHAETCAALLRAGISRDARTKVERTALHVAARAGHVDVAELLVRGGAAPDSRDLLLMTPLHWAAERGHVALVRLLMIAGADPHARSKFLLTPRDLARRRDHRDVLALLDRPPASPLPSLPPLPPPSPSTGRLRFLLLLRLIVFSCLFLPVVG